ncbi:MAG: carbohydrate porin [Verrucomicrobiota bacterium]
MRSLKPTLAGLGGLMLLATSPVHAQSQSDFEQLQAQLKAMQATIQDLQQKVNELNTTQAQPASVPSAEARSLAERVTALEADSIEAAKTLDVLDNFEFHGYVRSGFGVNQSGSQQQKPLNPDGLGASLPGRLGNEPDTYGELIFKYHFPQATPDSVKFDFVGNLMFQQNRDKASYLNISSTDSNIGIRESYITASNVIKTTPEVTFWAGNRYYDRHDIHRTDYYWLDMSGYGGGVENIPFGPGKVAIAYLNGASNTNTSTSTGEDLTKQVLDLRYSDLPSLGGKGTLWLSASYLNGGTPSAGPVATYPEATSGFGIGWIQDNTFGENLTNTAALLYGVGTSSQFDTNVSGYVGAPRGALDDSKTLLFIDTLVWQASDRFSVAADAVVQWNDLGFTPAGGSGSDRTYYAVGARPVYMFTDVLGAAVEVGYDYATDNRSTAGDDSPSLAKITFAQLIRPSAKFFARPEIRLYATYYMWNDFAAGSQINGTSGPSEGSWNFGIQAEAWW